MHALRTIIALLCVLVAGAFAAPVEVNDDYIVNNSTTENFDNPAASETHQHGAREVGQATYYIAGLGSCGVTNNGQAQDIVALPHGLMGAQSNGNPFCGKTVSISYKGKTASGTVQDKCMGCVS